MAAGIVRRGGKKNRKHGRGKRKSGRLEDRYLRAYLNKLRRVNRDRAKAGKAPLTSLPGYNHSTGKPS